MRGFPEVFRELPNAVIAEEILTPGPGQIRAFVTMGGNPILSTPSGHRLAEAFATLDLLIVGIVLVDSEARIVHANRAGARHLDEAQSVRRSDDRLSARDPVAAAALSDAIMRATRAGATLEVAKTGIAVPITGVDGRDLAAWVLPLDGGLRNEFASAFRAKVAVFLRELGDTAPLPGELFVRRYGITPAECRVLMLLAQGQHCGLVHVGEAVPFEDEPAHHCAGR